jgi:hypothetical protein
MEFPTFRYHREKEPKIFKNQAEIDAAGPGWVDSPAKLKEEDEVVKKVAKAKADHGRTAKKSQDSKEVLSKED